MNKIGTAEALLLLFLGLRLTDNIDWPWIWVLAPGWIAFIIGAVSEMRKPQP
jgi:hypothetical protein